LEKRLSEQPVFTPEPDQEVLPVISEPVEILDEVTIPISKPAITTKSASIPITVTTPAPTVDVCLNIEGVQTVAPLGYSSVSSMCTIIVVKDFCPNINGIQTKLPSGMIFYSNLGKCMTEAELNDLENEQSENDAKESDCDDAKEEKVDLNQEIYEINQHYSQLIAIAEQNPNGMCCGAVEQEVNRLNNLKYTETNPLYDRLLVVESEIGLYCY
jgi:hypothetical protein